MSAIIEYEFFKTHHISVIAVSKTFKVNIFLTLDAIQGEAVNHNL